MLTIAATLTMSKRNAVIKVSDTGKIVSPWMSPS